MTAGDHRLELYLAHRRALVEYATPIIGSRASAEEIVQEAYLRFVAGTRDRMATSPRAYLYRIVRNLAIDYTRKEVAERKRTSDVTAGVMPAEITTPEEQLIHSTELARVERALAALPDLTRRAFELYRYEGLTLQEVAVNLGVSIATAHRLTRAALAQCISALGESSEA